MQKQIQDQIIELAHKQDKLKKLLNLYNEIYAKEENKKIQETIIKKPRGRPRGSVKIDLPPEEKHQHYLDLLRKNRDLHNQDPNYKQVKKEYNKRYNDKKKQKRNDILKDIENENKEVKII
jgi:hypothetical protein